MSKDGAFEATHRVDRSTFIGGSDARIIMGRDQAALIRLWREKRKERAPEDLAGNLIVQLGHATEALNRHWYERCTGLRIAEVQAHVRHHHYTWMGATLDGRIKDLNAVFEAKFMLPWSFSEEAAVEKHTAQLQHNMSITECPTAVLSIITGGGKWVELKVDADPLYQAVLLDAEWRFWEAVQSGEPPRLFGSDAPIPRVTALRIVDMSGSNAWAEFSAVYCRTRGAHAEHEQAKAELKRLLPEDAKEAFGHGVRAKRSRAGAVSFELMEVAHAAQQ
jgi:predicted phage-related endonuclease